MSRKFLVLLLICTMCLSTLVACNTTSTPTSEQPSTSTQTPTTGGATTTPPTDNSPVDTSPIVNPFEGEDTTAKKQHVMMETLPSSATLVGSYSLPPIDNQGSVGSCASQSIAYTQFSNAVARYLNSIDSNSKFKPAEDDKYCFSPKFTYTYSGAGTEWVYRILMDHGCLTLEDSGFYKIGTGSTLESGGKYAKKSIKWDVAPGLAQKALQYRVTNFEQIWCVNAPYNGKITTSEAGKELIYKIKEAVASGNVVVTGGYPSRWQYGMVLSGGTLGKTGQSIITHSVAEGAGGHQVTIVGYDDNIATKLDGVVLKGAFLMANSWGTGYQDDGYVWVAYDALNTASEFEELNAEKFNRGWTFDQFCFTYWDSDIEVSTPELTVEIEMETNNRESFTVNLTREDADGVIASHVPQLIDYSDIHESYGKYVNFGGDVEGSADKGYLAFSYHQLLENLPAGTTYENFIWGLELKSKSSTFEAKVNNIKLINAKGEVISQIVPSEDNKVLSNNKSTKYTFDLGNELKSYRIDGQYIMKSEAAGKYISIPTSQIKYVASESSATSMGFVFDPVSNNYYITKGDRDNLVLGISEDAPKAGEEVKLTAKNPRKTNQTWKLKNNGDGTFSIYLELTDANGRYFAFGVKDGKNVLVSGADVEKYGKFTLSVAKATTTSVDYTVAVSGTKVDFAVKSNEKNLTFTNVVVTNAAGETVATEAVNGGELSKSFTLEKGTYSFNVMTAKHSYIYVVTVK